ncbi:MAG: 4-hydroxybenzoate polyprenyltransferase [Planctomycetota bacterium]|nr:MAG: 4-hydroxybenzoate polyprenyltransferase [Planctomycetota bacterium]
MGPDGSADRPVFLRPQRPAEHRRTETVDDSTGRHAVQNRLLAIVQLMRLPAVFTAFADVFAGFALRNGTVEFNGVFARLLVISGCLYTAGMVFNDVFDRREDARHRPGRPIPSGRVGLPAATLIGVLLIAAALGCAASLGRPTIELASALTAAVLLYDGWGKRTPLGPVVMGSCRALDVLVGASVAVASTGSAPPMDLRAPFAPPIVHAAVAMGVYVAGLTWFARREATGSTPRSLLAAAVVANLGIAGLLGFLLTTRPSNLSLLVVLLIVIALSINRRIAPALANPRPAAIQAAVGTMIQSIVMLHATVVLAATQSVAAAAATAALLVPALLLRRVVPIT